MYAAPAECCRVGHRDRRRAGSEPVTRSRFRHDLHQPHGALSRTRPHLPPLSACITARIQWSGTAKRLDASVTNAAKASKDRAIARTAAAVRCSASTLRGTAAMINDRDDTPRSLKIATVPSCSQPTTVKRRRPADGRPGPLLRERWCKLWPRRRNVPCSDRAKEYERSGCWWHDHSSSIVHTGTALPITVEAGSGPK